MLSIRGQRYKDIGYEHGTKDEYHPQTNPGGFIDLTTAENFLIHNDLIEFFNCQKFDKSCCAYGEGYTGTLRLRTEMARHMNEHFRPFTPLNAELITFVAGVTKLNEMCALLTCDADCGDSILLGRPNYGSFAPDMVSRGQCVRISQIFVDLEHGTDQFSTGDVDFYSAACEKAQKTHKTVKALVICNPHNPLGQCYTENALIALLRFCQSKQIHLISDEIYALSTYERSDRLSELFVSVLSIDVQQYIDPELVHVLYGMSKDYGAAGLRLGCLVTHNLDFSHAARGMCRFSSPSQFSMSLAADLLEDRVFMKKLLEKSRASLRRNREIAEEALDKAGIEYHKEGNAGMFLWLNLRPYLATSAVDGDEWAAERLFWECLKSNGYFRMVISKHEAVLLEGVRRIQKAYLQSKRLVDAATAENQHQIPEG